MKTSMLKTVGILLLFVSLACLPSSLYASGMTTGVVTTPVGGILGGSLSLSQPTPPLGVADIWVISGGPLTFTATQAGTVSLKYDYYNSSATPLTGGQWYSLTVAADDQFWSSSDPNIDLSSLTLTSTLSRDFSPNPVGLWSLSATYGFAETEDPLVGSEASPLNIVGSAETSGEVPYSTDAAFDQTSTMVFTNVQVGDVISINMPADDRTEVDPVAGVPEPATLTLLGLGLTGLVAKLAKRRNR